MDTLHPDAQAYLETLRELGTALSRQQLDAAHGELRAMEQTTFMDPEYRRIFGDKARAVEIRLKELEVIALIGGDV